MRGVASFPTRTPFPQVTRKGNHALGYKRRYLRLYGSVLIVYRDETHDIIKDTYNITGWRFAITRGAKGKLGLTSRSDLYRFSMSNPKDASTDQDWASEESEAHRTAWLEALVAAARVTSDDGTAPSPRGACK